MLARVASLSPIELFHCSRVKLHSIWFTVTVVHGKAWHVMFVNLPRASSLTGTRRLQSLATTGAGPGCFRTTFSQSVGFVPVASVPRVPRDTLHRRIIAKF